MICGTLVTVMVPLKMIFPWRKWRNFWTKVMLGIGSLFIWINKGIVLLVHRVVWEISGLKKLDLNRQYLVLSNHQSSVDIPVIQGMFHKVIPFPRFFIKQQLLWVPFLGLALWALDMPVMKRYSKSKLKKRPDLRGKDLERSRKACEQLRDQPLTLLNFVEGTRIDPSKHSDQNSPFQYLLRPKSGGIHAVLQALGDQLEAILDVTIIYPGFQSPGLSDLVFGRLRRIRVDVDQLCIGEDGVPTLEQIRSREAGVHIRKWLNERWQRKEQLIKQYLEEQGEQEFSEIMETQAAVPDPV
jgi:1-acyl-sn-glycerol-3-phosphate acyltransferase